MPTTEEARRVCARNSGTPENKKANRLFETVGLLSSFLLPLRLCHSRRRQGDKLCVCSGRSQKVVKNLAGWRRTRAPKLSPHGVFDHVEALPRGHHYRVLTVGNPVHGQGPTPVYHVQASGDRRNGRESYGEQRN